MSGSYEMPNASFSNSSGISVFPTSQRQNPSQRPSNPKPELERGDKRTSGTSRTAQGYDTPGTGMFAPQVLDPTVERLAELAGDGRALEFAIGTGRVAVPLAERGISVTGIELSQAMVDQLRTKVDEARIPVVVGDMATARAPG